MKIFFCNFDIIFYLKFIRFVPIRPETVCESYRSRSPEVRNSLIMKMMRMKKVGDIP